MKLNRGVLKAAEFKGLEWVNSDPILLKDLKGKVVLVHFWDYTYYSCLHSLTYIKVWNGRYRDKGLVVVGVHAPEFSFSRKRENIIRAVEDMGIDFPVAMDNNFETWKAFSNRYWPSDYLIDSKGFLADYHIGDRGYQEFELSIQELLRELNPHVVLPKPIELLSPDSANSGKRSGTPDLYLGFRRGRIGNAEGFVPNQVVDYARPRQMARDIYHAVGKWSNQPECLRFEGGGTGEIIISYQAKAVVVVVEPGTDGVQEFEVLQDGKYLASPDKDLDTVKDGERSVVKCTYPKLYKVVSNKAGERHVLTLRTQSRGLCFYSLNFITFATL